MAALDCDSERIWKNVENCRVNVPKKRRQSSDSLSLLDRLYDCYVECTQTGLDKSADKRFRNAVNLLEHLSPNHAHPSLIVNLYPDEQGYSLVLSPKKGNETEEFYLPYEDNEIFSYLDNQELPPVLVEVLGQTKFSHMYNGCVVCEVRDYRSFSRSHGNYDRHLLLLKPTAETILSTVEEMAFETGCSAEDKLLLESRLLLATQPPICLDPSTDVVCYTNRLQYNQRKFHTPAIRRTLRRRSHARRARMHMTLEGVAPRGLQLHDFIRERSKSRPGEKKRDFSSCWKKPKIDHSLEETPEMVIASVLHLARPVTPPPLVESIPQLNQLSVTAHPKPHPQPHPSTVLRPPPPPPPPSIHTLEEREEQSDVVNVQNDVTHIPGLPPSHPPMSLPDHPQVPTCVNNRVPPQPVEHAHPYYPHPPPSHPPPIVSPPPTSTTITPPQPHPLTPTHPSVPPPRDLTESAPAHAQPTMKPSANVPVSANPMPVQTTLSSQAPPTLQAPPPPPPPPQSVTSQYQQAMNYGPIQLPPGVTSTPELLKLVLTQYPGVTPTPELLKLVLAQYQAQAAKKPRPLAPAVTMPTVVGGGAPNMITPPSLVGKPPALSQGAPSTVALPRSSSSTQVQVRPTLNLLSAPPSLTPSPKKRPPLTQPTQMASPAQAGMPKLHPLSHETPSQKPALPAQPVLSKPVAPPPPLSASTATAPPTMPTLHKITGAANLPQQQKPPLLQQQKATPIVGGAIPAPPLRPNPTIAMPKLTSSAGQVKLGHTAVSGMPPLSGQVKLQGHTAVSGMPVLSRAPVSLQPPPLPKLHPQIAVSGSGKADGVKATSHSKAATPSKKKTTGGGGSKSHKSGSSVGKGSKSKKKK